MNLAGLVLAAYVATLPNFTSLPGRCREDSLARSNMRLELWFQARASPWPPPDWRTWAPRYAPELIAASRDTFHGVRVRISIPDTLPHGTLIPRARGPGGLSCDGNYLPSRTTE